MHSARRVAAVTELVRPIRRIIRIIGYLLHIWGFICLVLSAASAHKSSVMPLRHHLSKLPKQETFAREEVGEIIWRASFDREQPFARAVVPPLLMLYGGILLDKGSRRRKDVSYVA